MVYPKPIDSIPRLIAAYENGATVLFKAIAGMTDREMRTRVKAKNAGRWSTLELVSHLADAEQVYADRIKRSIAMDKPLLMGFDEERYTQRLAYHRRDAIEEIALIAATRRQVTRILRTLPKTAWDRPGVHSERGIVTVKQFVNGATGHLIHHAGFIPLKRRAMSR